jgi:hypothetical protein
MEHMSWQSPAILVPPGNRPNYSGTLADCLRHWRDEMSPVEQVTAMIAMGGGRWLAPNEIISMVNGLPRQKPDKSKTQHASAR